MKNLLKIILFGCLISCYQAIVPAEKSTKPAATTAAAASTSNNDSPYASGSRTLLIDSATGEVTLDDAILNGHPTDSDFYESDQIRKLVAAGDAKGLLRAWKQTNPQTRIVIQTKSAIPTELSAKLKQAPPTTATTAVAAMATTAAAATTAVKPTPNAPAPTAAGSIPAVHSIPLSTTTITVSIPATAGNFTRRGAIVSPEAMTMTRGGSSSPRRSASPTTLCKCGGFSCAMTCGACSCGPCCQPATTVTKFDAI